MRFISTMFNWYSQIYTCHCGRVFSISISKQTKQHIPAHLSICIINLKHSILNIAFHNNLVMIRDPLSQKSFLNFSEYFQYSSSYLCQFIQNLSYTRESESLHSRWKLFLWLKSLSHPNMQNKMTVILFRNRYV